MSYVYRCVRTVTRNDEDEEGDLNGSVCHMYIGVCAR